jgi:hypothetical protein
MRFPQPALPLGAGIAGAKEPVPGGRCQGAVLRRGANAIASAAANAIAKAAVPEWRHVNRR